MLELELISSVFVLTVNFVCSIMLWVLCRGSKPKITLALLSTLITAWNLFAVLLMPEMRFDRMNFYYATAAITGAVLIYIYMLYLMKPGPNIRKEKRLLFFTLLLLGGVYFFIRLFYPPVVLNTYRDIFLHISSPEVWFRILVGFCYLLFYARAVLLILFLYYQHRRRIAELYSYSEQVSLSWVPLVCWLFILYGSVCTLDIFFAQPGSVQVVVFNFFFAVFYLTINMTGVSQQDVYTPAETARIKTDEREMTENMTMPSVTRRQLSKALVGLMEEEKIYLNPELRLDAVAQMLKTNRTYISAIINEDFGKSFIVYVNEYRIKAAQHRLLDPEEDGNVAMIAEAVGFKSHSSFVEFFKRFSGMSPSEFRKKGNRELPLLS